MGAIIDIFARDILDSRGNPTVEVDVILESGAKGRAAVPSGASTGKYEAVELRDDDDAFHGKGVLKAVEAVNGEIFEALSGRDSHDQAALDELMVTLDGTPNKSRLGANAILGVSLALARASAEDQGLPLYRFLGGLKGNLMPMPLMNIMNGGVHGDNGIDFQEFMIVPVGAQSFYQAVQMGSEIFQTLKSILKQKGLSTNVGDEGGFAPPIDQTRLALDLILNAIDEAGYNIGEGVSLALDVAASEFYQDGKYHLKGEKKTFSSLELVKYYEQLVKDYPIISIEDGMDQDDTKGWQSMTQSLGQKIQIVGDDLYVTNVERLQKGIEEGLSNAILIKPNQIGTLTETFDTLDLATFGHFSSIISHRSGETEDTFIADLAVAAGCGQIKTGSLSRTDRVAKYNQLMRIEEELGRDARFLNPFPR